LRDFGNSLKLDEYSPYSLTSNEEIDLLKGVIEFDDITHLRRQWYVIYDRTFYLGGRPGFPSIEYNLNKYIVPNNKEPCQPEDFFKMYHHAENNGITVGVSGKNGRILPGFSTITADIES